MVRGDRSVDVFVRKLRQKLEKASPKWHYIHTHFGIGYRFAAEATAAARVGEEELAVLDVGGGEVGDESQLAGAQQHDELTPATL
jgi:DNA-binding winged helix-turn-helix (wHTH) protein